MKKFAVIGQPIKHSLSPWIHSEFAKEAGIKISYEALEVGKKEFGSKARALLENGYEGLNVTLPLKELAFNFADLVSEKGRQTEAVNTLWKQKGKVCADSTDGIGLLKDLEVNNLFVENTNLIILGAGGAARSIIPSLLELKPKRLFILNRTKSKSSDLAKKYGSHTVKIHCGISSTTEDILSENPCIVINTTSFGTHNEELHIPDFNTDVLSKAIWSYDLSYSNEVTPFNKLAQGLGCPLSLDGLGMLVNQAAASFEIWTGIEPETQKVNNLIKNNL